MKNLATKEESQVRTLDTDSFIIKAIESNVPVETMERLLAMQKEVKADRAKEMYFTALSQFQAKCPIIKKTKEVKGKDGKVRYRYAPLEAIVEQVSPLMDEFELSYLIKTEYKEGHIIATCEAHHTAGHVEPTSFPIPIDEDAYMNSAQKSGSALTYAKRYAFCNAFGILTGDQDDDAQSLGGGVNINDVYRKATYHMNAVMDNIETVLAVKEYLQEDKLEEAAEAWSEINDYKVIQSLSLAPTKGGCFTVEERKKMNSDEFKGLMAEFRKDNPVTGL